MSVGAIIMVGHECTTSVVTVDSLALFPNHTSDSGSDGRGKLASGTSVRSNLVESGKWFDRVGIQVAGYPVWPETLSRWAGPDPCLCIRT